MNVTSLQNTIHPLHPSRSLECVKFSCKFKHPYSDVYNALIVQCYTHQDKNLLMSQGFRNDKLQLWHFIVASRTH